MYLYGSFVSLLIQSSQLGLIKNWSIRTGQRSGIPAVDRCSQRLAKMNAVSVKTDAPANLDAETLDQKEVEARVEKAGG